MTKVLHAAGPDTSYVRINRLKDSYTWNVQVASVSGSFEDLAVAKERALAISRELEQTLLVQPEPTQVEDEVPF
jgi:hypothetical protein